LARAFGVPASAVAEGLRTFTPAGHRIADVGEIDGVRYIDDSKATSPHAASASLTSFDSIVWIAGGLGKDIPFDELVVAAAPRLRAVVLFGSCRAQIHDSITRHAANVPVVEVAEPETDDVNAILDRVVAQAAAFAKPGDVVLLAPAAASMDMFRDYKHRGDAFAAAVDRLRGSRR
jgi:UDP-N-acetylmuramoylalanine--D-glutamate ligase